MIRIDLLGPGEEGILESVAPDVFDHAVRPELAREFLADPRHHLAVALDGEVVVGMASAVHYIHPDKPPELWVNEVGVASTHRRRGLGTALLRALFEAGRRLGCSEAWVLTERGNQAATGLYAELGGRSPDDETVLFSFRLEAELGPE